MQVCQRWYSCRKHCRNILAGNSRTAVVHCNDALRPVHELIDSGSILISHFHLLLCLQSCIFPADIPIKILFFFIALILTARPIHLIPFDLIIVIIFEEDSELNSEPSKLPEAVRVLLVLVCFFLVGVELRSTRHCGHLMAYCVGPGWLW
jgi:hypothetical protein